MALFSAGAASASGAARRTGHQVALALTGTMMVVFVGYTTYATRTRRAHVRPTLRRIGPLMLACVAAVLIVLDPIRHVLMDETGGHIDGADLAWLLREYTSAPDCDTESFKCFALGGWIFTFACTYVGFACLLVSTLWMVDARQKLRDMRERWREIRSAK